MVNTAVSDDGERPKKKNRIKGEGSIWQKPNGLWMYGIMVNGKRGSRSLGTHDEETARKNFAVAQNLASDVRNNKTPAAKSQGVTLTEILDQYLEHVRINEYDSEKEIKLVIGLINRAPEFGDGEKATRKVSSLITEDFRRYRNRLTDPDGLALKHSTVNNHLAYVRAALNLEAKQTPSRIDKVPFIPSVKVNNTREGFVEWIDRLVLLDCLVASLKCLFIIAFHSGCRKGELLNMRWKDVDFRLRIVRLPHTKNGKQRNLPFWGDVEKSLKAQKAYRDKHHPEASHVFFWMAEDCQLSHGGMRNVPGEKIEDFRGSWDKAVEAASQRTESISADLLFHDLRRSAIRVMVQEAGIPESQAMLISGHDTNAMLQRYNIVSLKNLHNAGAALDAWALAQATP